MPEILVALPGLRHTGGGITESDSRLLQDLRKSGALVLWSGRGTDQELEENWVDFCLLDMPEGSMVWG